jgi:hypothetical protein
MPSVPVQVATTLCPELFSNWGTSSRTISFVAPVASIAMSAAVASKDKQRLAAVAKRNVTFIEPPNRSQTVSDRRTAGRVVTMSALGQKQTYAARNVTSALHPIATAKADLRQTPCLFYPRKRHWPLGLLRQCHLDECQRTSALRAPSCVAEYK